MSPLEAIVSSLCEVVISYCEISNKRQYSIVKFLNLAPNDFIAELQPIIKEATSKGSTRNTLLEYLALEIYFLKPLMAQPSLTEEDLLKVHQHLRYLITNVTLLLTSKQGSTFPLTFGDTHKEIPGLIVGLSSDKLSKFGNTLSEKFIATLPLSHDFSPQAINLFMKSLIEEHKDFIRREDEKNNIITEYKALKPEAECLAKDRETTERKNNLLKEEITQYKQEINKQNVESALLKAETNTLKDTIKYLKAEQKKITEHLELNKSKFQQSQKEIQNLNRQGGQNKVTIAQLSEKNNFLQESNHDLKNTLQKNEEQLQTLKHQLNQKNAKIQELIEANKKISTIEESNSHLTNENQALNERLQTLLQELHASVNEIENIKQALQATNDEKNELEKSKTQIHQELKEKNVGFNEQFEILTSQARKDNHRIMQLEKSMEEYEKASQNSDVEIQKYLEENSHLKTQLEEQNKIIDQLEKENIVLKESKEALNKTVEEKNQYLQNIYSKKPKKHLTENSDLDPTPLEFERGKKASFAERFSSYFRMHLNVMAQPAIEPLQTIEPLEEQAPQRNSTFSPNRFFDQFDQFNQKKSNINSINNLSKDLSGNSSKDAATAFSSKTY